MTATGVSDSWWLHLTVVVPAVLLVVAATKVVGASLRPRVRRPSAGAHSSVGATTRSVVVRRALARFDPRRRSRRTDPIPSADVAAWCDALSRRLRAGDALRTALEFELPSDKALRARTEPIRRSLEQGAPVAAAVSVPAPAGAPVRNPTTHGHEPHLGLLCSVIAAIAEFGGSAAAPVDRVGATLRQRTADGQERAAQSAQARLSARVLTVVPLAVVALLVITDPGVRDTVIGGAGLAVVSIGLVLNLSGWWWMNRMIAGVG